MWCVAEGGMGWATDGRRLLAIRGGAFCHPAGVTTCTGQTASLDFCGEAKQSHLAAAIGGGGVPRADGE